MKLLLPDSLPFRLDVPPEVEQVVYPAAEPIAPEHEDAEAIVLWGAPIPLILEAAPRLRRIRLVQALMAGPDFLPGAGFPADAVLCNGVGLHGPAVSEHALALTLALVRRFPLFAREQAAHHWRGDLGGNRPWRPHTRPVDTLRGARVVVWGFGDLGQSYARLVATLGAEVTGIARTAGERAGFPVTADPRSVLGDADVVCLCLPSAPAPALDAATLEALPDGVIVINVGRGTAIDHDAVLHALRTGKVGGAGLDVADPEPLPSDSPLWDEPDVIITPHAAGGRPLGYDELISANVRHLLAGEPCRNRMNAPKPNNR